MLSVCAPLLLWRCVQCRELIICWVGLPRQTGGNTPCGLWFPMSRSCPRFVWPSRGPSRDGSAARVATQTKLNVLSGRADGEHPSGNRWHLGLDRVLTGSDGSEINIWFVLCGTAVLFASIMKWYWYGSGNREIRALEMDSKSQLTPDRWRLQFTCFQTPVLNFWIPCKGSPGGGCRLFPLTAYRGKKAGMHFHQIISITWSENGIFFFFANLKCVSDTVGVMTEIAAGGRAGKVDVTWHTVWKVLLSPRRRVLPLRAAEHPGTNCRGSTVMSCHSSCSSLFCSDSDK